jgi:RNA polymerase sigma factor (sigma-70 family)
VHPDEPPFSGAKSGVFATTHWSAVLAAGQNSDPQASLALEQLCRTYWYPLYLFVRRRGCGPEDAQDLTQAFFAHLLSKEFLRGVAPEKGRFRSFLLACLKNFLVDEWEKTRTEKRGGPTLDVLDLHQAEQRYQVEPSAEATPEAFYDRRWAMDLLHHVLERLRAEVTADHKDSFFRHVQPCLLGEPLSETYAQLGARLGISETAVKVSVHRLRLRYRELLRQEIAHTVSEPAEVESEMRYLCQVVSR